MQVIASLQYDKLQQIGVGQGMNSKVFLAQDPQLGGILAVKEIEKENFGNLLQNYYAEAQAMFAANCINIVPIKYACETTTHVCLAMPYFNKGSLADRIIINPLPLKEIIKVGQEVLIGLAQIHIKNYIHFDIKPSNILFSDTNIAMLADFGQTRRLGPEGVITSLPPMYENAIPPELFQELPGVIQSDIYQVGLTFYRAANGDAFFKKQAPSNDVELMQNTISGKFPNRNLFMPHIPKDLKKVIRKSLKLDPKERFTSAKAFAIALGRVDIPLDWHTLIFSNEDIEWRASQGVDKAVILVKLLGDIKNSEWSIEIHTERLGKKRAKHKDLWRKELSSLQAMAYLETVFQTF